MGTVSEKDQQPCTIAGVSTSYLTGIGYIHDLEMEEFAENNGKSTDQLIDDMVNAGWTQGRDNQGWFEYWE